MFDRAFVSSPRHRSDGWEKKLLPKSVWHLAEAHGRPRDRSVSFLFLKCVTTSSGIYNTSHLDPNSTFFSWASLTRIRACPRKEGKIRSWHRPSIMEGDVAMEAGVRSVYICILKPRRRHEARRWLCVYDLDAGEEGTKTAANMSSPILRLAWEECVCVRERERPCKEGQGRFFQTIHTQNRY